MMMMMNNEIHMYRSRLSAAVMDIDIADILGQKYRQMRFGPSSSQSFFYYLDGQNQNFVTYSMGRKQTINMRIQYVGRTTYCEGKRLYDILCRLKNFGVGRIVVRNHYLERYPEPTYYVIGKVMPDMSDPTQVIRLSTVRAPVLFTCEPISTGSKDVYSIITNLRTYVKIFSFFLLSASPFSISP